jgi:LAO/AO transport system kinase
MTKGQKEKLLQSYLDGDRYALAKMLTHAENGSADLPFFFDGLYSRVGRAYRVGITGPPGAGKSTLVEALSRKYKEQGKTVGVIAVDPTSPFSGGALLGDRIRMQSLNLEEGIFVRSMASRGSVGGLARATDEAADVMDAYGFDVVLIETVGVGQSEVDVASLVDSTLVVLFPGAGDMIQAMKAGLMEIADIFAINKADLGGADLVQQEIADSLALKCFDGWRPTLFGCSAREGEGVDELLAELDRHHAHLVQVDAIKARRLDHQRKKVMRLVNDDWRKNLWERQGPSQRLDEVLAGHGSLSPYRLAEKLEKDIMQIFCGKKSGS